jgi:hypothetical protein
MAVERDLGAAGFPLIDGSARPRSAIRGAVRVVAVRLREVRVTLLANRVPFPPAPLASP